MSWLSELDRLFCLPHIEHNVILSKHEYPNVVLDEQPRDCTIKFIYGYVNKTIEFLHLTVNILFISFIFQFYHPVQFLPHPLLPFHPHPLFHFSFENQRPFFFFAKWPFPLLLVVSKVIKYKVIYYHFSFAESLFIHGWGSWTFCTKFIYDLQESLIQVAIPLGDSGGFKAGSFALLDNTEEKGK